MPNLQAAIDQNLRCLKCNRILAGGPGSGCRGPACGRPSKGEEKPKRGRRALEKELKELKEKEAFKKWQKGGVDKTKSKDVREYLKQHREDFRKQVRNALKAPKKNLGPSKGRVKEVKTIKYRGRKVDVKVLRPVSKGRPPVPMGKSDREASKGFRQHGMKGRFAEDVISPLHEPTHTMHIWEAEKDPHGRGATVFALQVKDSPTKSHVAIEEHKRSENREIESTKKYEFKSSSLAKSFMQDRYGIKIQWSKGKKK